MKVKEIKYLWEGGFESAAQRETGGLFRSGLIVCMCVCIFVVKSDFGFNQVFENFKI